MTSEQIKIVNNIKFSIINAIDNIDSEQMWGMIEKAYEQKEKEPCDDCISREEAIRIAEQGQIQGYEWEFKKLCTLPSVTPKQEKWIPVTERLPEEDGQYLITVKYKPEADYENIYAEHGEWTDGRWDMFCFGHCGEVESIVAWMPLPEPYVESEE